VLAAALAGCAGPPCDREPPLDWDNWGRAFMTDFCGGCHSVLYGEEDRDEAPLGVDFNTYGDVMHWSGRVLERVSVTADMPPAGGPSEEERAMLEEWITCSVEPDKAALEAQE